MKRGLWAGAVLLAWGGLGWSEANAQPAGIPHPDMNRHYPFYITCSYWAPCGYGIAGASDRIWPCPQPVNGIGPPPFGPRPQCPPSLGNGYPQPALQGPQAPQGVPYYYYPGGQYAQQPPPIVWSRFVRSPRDFFMVDVPRR